MENKNSFENKITSGKAINEVKSQLRRDALALRNRLDVEKRQEFSRIIVNNLTLSPIYEQAAAIHSYISFGSEVETNELFAAIFAAGKRAATSIVISASEQLAHSFIRPDTQFAVGKFGVPAPVGEQLLEAGELTLTSADIIIVPLVAFDRMRNRIGYGKGYYDRFLANSMALRVGFGFSCQEADAIPTEPTDVAMNYIFTENEILGCK